MAVIRWVLRVYSWIFEALLCLVAIAVPAVTLLSGNEELHIGWLPWKEPALETWLISLGVVGLLCVVLAVTGRMRVLLFLFALGIVVLLAKGFFLGFGYSFESSQEAKNALLLLTAAFIAMIGAWPSAPARR